MNRWAGETQSITRSFASPPEDRKKTSKLDGHNNGQLKTKFCSGSQIQNFNTNATACFLLKIPSRHLGVAKHTVERMSKRGRVEGGEEKGNRVFFFFFPKLPIACLSLPWNPLLLTQISLPDLLMQEGRLVYELFSVRSLQIRGGRQRREAAVPTFQILRLCS